MSVRNSLSKPVSVGYLVSWRTSFRQYRGVVISIDYDEALVDNCEVLVVYELDDREIYTLPRRDYRVSLIEPCIDEYLRIVLDNYVVGQSDRIIPPEIKYSILHEALDRIDERNDEALIIAKSKALNDLQREYDFLDISAQRRSRSSYRNSLKLSTMSILDLSIRFDATETNGLSVNPNDCDFKHKGLFEESNNDALNIEKKVGNKSEDYNFDDNNIARMIASDSDDNADEDDLNEDSDDEEDEDADDDDEDDEDDDDEDDEDDGSDEEQRINVKVFISHADETRGFSISPSSGFTKITNQLKKDYKGYNLSLYYLDNDGDKIHIAAKTDFDYAVQSIRRASPRVSNGMETDSPVSSPRLVLRLTAVIAKETPIHSPKKHDFKGVRQSKTRRSTKNEIVGHDSEIIWQRGELLGSGSFGRVYSGVDMKTGNKIAVKEINLAIGQTQSRKALEQAVSIQREVRVLSTLDHKNIVKYFGTEYLNDVIRIFLELATDGSIKDFIHKFGGLAEPILRRYAHDIVSGLAYLHEQGVIHRDIKPSNLLVFNGVIKLADFGCAAMSKVDDIAMSNSAHGTMAGTTIYMSPEIMQLGNSGSPQSNKFSGDDLNNVKGSTVTIGYGRKTDIWSLGITLVEMALGKAPFRNAAAAIYSVCVVREYPKLPDDMSDTAKDFLSLCLIEDSKYRASANDLLSHQFLISSDISSGSNTVTDRHSSIIYSSTSINVLPTFISKATSPPPSNRPSVDIRSDKKDYPFDRRAISELEKLDEEKESRSRRLSIKASQSNILSSRLGSEDDDMLFTTVGKNGVSYTKEESLTSDDFTYPYQDDEARTVSTLSGCAVTARSSMRGYSEHLTDHETRK